MNYELFKNKDINIRFSFIVLFSSYFFHELINVFIRGGRWDLNQHIAFGDRIFYDNIVTYSSGIEDLFLATSPYFPGVGFLSYLLRFLWGDNSSYLAFTLLAISTFLTALLLIAIISYSNRILLNKSNKIYCSSIILILFIVSLDKYKFYAMEFKPDTLIMLFALILIMLHDKLIKRSHLYFAITVGFLYLASFFKQQSVFLYIVFALLIFFSDYSPKSKLIRIVTLFITGIIFLLSVYILPNVYYSSVEVMANHSINSFEKSIRFLWLTVKDNLILLSLILPGFFIYLSNVQSIKYIYILSSITWVMLNISGLIKSGGNTGNSEVMLVWLIPFAALTIDKLLSFKYFRSKKMSTAIHICLVLLMFIMSLSFLNSSYLNLNRLSDKMDKQEQSVAWLKGRSNSEYTLIDANVYIEAHDAKMGNLTDMFTIIHFRNQSSHSEVLNLIENRKFEFIMLSHRNEIYDKYIPGFRGAILKNYVHISDKPDFVKFHVFEAQE